MINKLIYSGKITILIILCIILIGYIVNLVTELIMKLLVQLVGIRLAYIIGNYLTFMGVIHHELSHVLVALLTGAKITDVKLFKLPSARDSSLGSVTFITRGPLVLRSLQSTLAPLAPVFCGAITVKLLHDILRYLSIGLGSKLIIYYIIISVLMHMKLSAQDIRVSLSGLPVTSLLIFMISFILV